MIATVPSEPPSRARMWLKILREEIRPWSAFVFGSLWVIGLFVWFLLALFRGAHAHPVIPVLVDGPIAVFSLIAVNAGIFFVMTTRYRWKLCLGYALVAASFVPATLGIYSLL